MAISAGCGVSSYVVSSGQDEHEFAGGRVFLLRTVVVLLLLAIGAAVPSIAPVAAVPGLPAVGDSTAVASAAATVNDVLSAVSCPSRNACEAVGYWVDASGGLAPAAAAWNGRNWVSQAVPSPVGAGDADLWAVSCAAADSCEALGGATSTGGSLEEAFAERWDGKTWAAQSIPLPSKAQYGTLDGVSCVGSTCEAVGSYHWKTLTEGGVFTLAERWNGSEWRVQTTIHPSSPAGDVMNLTAVSCVPGGTCDAVGSNLPGNGTEQSLAEQWSGTKWVQQTTVNPKGQNLALYGISCSSSAACEAVGDNVIESWNGTAWAMQQTATPSGDNATDLWGVSCPETGRCETVGSTFNAAAFQLTLAEVLAGASWADQATPAPTGSESGMQGNLDAVSCSAPTACEAVGAEDVAGSGNYIGIADRWNGTRWSAQAPPSGAAWQGTSAGDGAR
jgi:hypothetical protein